MSETIRRWFCGTLWLAVSMFLWHIIVIDPESINQEASLWAWVVLWTLWVFLGLAAFHVREP